MSILRKRLIWLKNAGLGHGFLALHCRSLRGRLAAITTLAAFAAIAVAAAAWLALLAFFLAFRARLNVGRRHRCHCVACLVQA